MDNESSMKSMNKVKQANAIEVFINGELCEFSNGIKVSEYLASVGILAENCIVEMNGEILPRENYETVVLKNKDQLELVRFVGGG